MKLAEALIAIDAKEREAAMNKLPGLCDAQRRALIRAPEDRSFSWRRAHFNIAIMNWIIGCGYATFANSLNGDFGATRLFLTPAGRAERARLLKEGTK